MGSLCCELNYVTSFQQESWDHVRWFHSFQKFLKFIFFCVFMGHCWFSIHGCIDSPILSYPTEPVYFSFRLRYHFLFRQLKAGKVRIITSNLPLWDSANSFKTWKTETTTTPLKHVYEEFAICEKWLSNFYCTLIVDTATRVFCFAGVAIEGSAIAVVNVVL